MFIWSWYLELDLDKVFPNLCRLLNLDLEERINPYKLNIQSTNMQSFCCKDEVYSSHLRRSKLPNLTERNQCLISDSHKVTVFHLPNSISPLVQPGGCSDMLLGNPATLEAKFRDGVGSVPVGGNSPSIGGWILWPTVIQQKERSLNKYWDLNET